MRLKIVKNTNDPVIRVKVSGTVDNRSARNILQIALLELHRSNRSQLRLDLSEAICSTSLNSFKLYNLVQTFKGVVVGNNTSVSIQYWGEGKRWANIEKAEDFPGVKLQSYTSQVGMSGLLLSGELCKAVH